MSHRANIIRFPTRPTHAANRSDDIRAKVAAIMANAVPIAPRVPANPSHQAAIAQLLQAVAVLLQEEHA